MAIYSLPFRDVHHDILKSFDKSMSPYVSIEFFVHYIGHHYTRDNIIDALSVLIEHGRISTHWCKGLYSLHRP